jgi:phosphoadenosine phosphosulfate reductase
VKFDAHYSVTSVDPPELVRFIKTNYPDVKFERRHDKNGKPVTMWSLIPERKMPPTRIARYCCEELKESNGKGRWTITGVRWAESVNRKANQGVITVPKAGARFMKKMEETGANFTKTIRGGVVLNYDDNPDRRFSEYCMRTGKAMLNPIIDWDEEDVWQFLNENNIPHCCLYDEGFARLGCIVCPMGRRRRMEKEFERWPKYKALYLKTFSRLLEVRKKAGLPCENWETPEDIMNWWLGEGKA